MKNLDHANLRESEGGCHNHGYLKIDLNAEFYSSLDAKGSSLFLRHVLALFTTCQP